MQHLLRELLVLLHLLALVLLHSMVLVLLHLLESIFAVSLAIIAQVLRMVKIIPILLDEL